MSIGPGIGPARETALIQTTVTTPTSTSYRPSPVARTTETAPRVLVVGESPVASEPFRSLSASKVLVEIERDLGRALQRCLQENVEMLFVNLFRWRASELTALAMFRQARPDQYVAVCAEESLLASLEQAGLADAFFVLEAVHES
jgi:hypothetical protein